MTKDDHTVQGQSRVVTQYSDDQGWSHITRTIKDGHSIRAIKDGHTMQ